MDRQKINWVSEEAEVSYQQLNKVYGSLLIKKFPYIKKVEIDKDGFNDIFKLNNKYVYYGLEIKIYICADFTSPDYRIYGGFGEHNSKIINSVNMMLSHPSMKNKRLRPSSIIKNSKNCEE